MDDRSDVVGSQTFIDQSWSTPQPILVRDGTFGMVRLRSFGTYSFRVVDSPRLADLLVGDQDGRSAASVFSCLNDLIVAQLSDILSHLQITLLDLPTKYDSLVTATQARLSDQFAAHGLELVDFFVNAIVPPEEVQRTINGRDSLGAAGDLGAFLKSQTANSMAKMAEQGESAGHIASNADYPTAIPGMTQRVPTGVVGTEPRTTPSGAAAAGVSLGPDLAQIAPTTTDPRTVVRTVAIAAEYAIAELNSTLRITVRVGPLRRQVVNVAFGQTDPVGHPTVHYWSVCGPHVAQDALELLRSNGDILHGALALKRVGPAEVIVLQANHLAETLTPREISQTLAAIAWQANRFEQKLTMTGKDA